jgi:hypothetical protein
MYMKEIYKLLNTIGKKKSGTIQAPGISTKTSWSKFIRFFISNQKHCWKENKGNSQQEAIMPKSLTSQSCKMLCIYEYTWDPLQKLPCAPLRGVQGTL